MNTLHSIVKIKRVNPDAPIPTKIHPTDAAYDLCTMEDVTLRPGEFKMVGSGIAVVIPAGYCGKVYPRFGLGCKGLVLRNGISVINANYHGEIMLPLMNNKPTHLYREIVGEYRNNDGRDSIINVHKGDCVAQLCIELVPDIELVVGRD